MSKKEYRNNFSLNTGDCKPSLTLVEQLDLMIRRGLVVNDRKNALDIIRRTSYYRLSAYSLSLRKSDHFYENVTFDNIYELYRFDDAFRKIIFDYASYVEIAFRAYVAHTISQKYGPLGYMNPKNFSNKNYHQMFLEHLTEEIKRSDDVFVEHHYRNRDSIFPIWVAIECTSFGELSKLFKNMKAEDKQIIIDQWFSVSEEYISNWLHCSVFARNVAAHGGRFYNRTFKSVSVRLQGQLRKQFSGEDPFAFVVAINQLLPSKALAKQFRNDLKALFEKYPFAQKEKLGFPDSWESILISQTNDYEYYDKIESMNC